MNFWDFFWLLVWTFFFVAYLMMLFQIFGDLFRDHELSGWVKALWVIFLIVFPFLGALVYLIARGKGMAQRQAGDMRRMQEQTDARIREVAGTGSSATDQIASAKALLDSGAITAAEFDQLKSKALS